MPIPCPRPWYLILKKKSFIMRISRWHRTPIKQLMKKILLTTWDVKTHCKQWDKLPTSTGELIRISEPSTVLLLIYVYFLTMGIGGGSRSGSSSQSLPRPCCVSCPRKAPCTATKYLSCRFTPAELPLGSAFRRVTFIGWILMGGELNPGPGN